MKPAKPQEPRSRRTRMLRVLSVSVAALLAANGAVLAENATGWDIEDLIKDGIKDARAALARALDPNNQDGTELEAGRGTDESSTSTTAPAAGGEQPSDSSTTSSSAPSSEAGAPTGGSSSSTSPGKKPGSSSTPTTSRSGSPSSPTSPGVQTPGGGAVTPAATGPDATLASLRSFVERERGLTYKSSVKITPVDDATFKSRLATYRLGPKTDAARRVEGPMKALGLIAPDVDLVAQMNRLSTGTAPAFYDAAANELLVRGDVEAPFTRKILIHEFTHALNDQHFELNRPDLRSADDETAQAFEALFEGIASDIEDRYVKAMSDADKKAVETEQRRLAGLFPRDLPQYVLINFGFPYTAGKRLAASLFGAGGAGRLNEAFSRPPTTTEQVLRPEKYGAGEAPLALAPPAADGAVVSQGVLGQLTLALMLAEAVDGGVAEAAADGWGADRWVSWQNGGQTCVRLAVVMDSPEHSAELAQALTEWAAARPGAVVEGTGPFTVTRCV